MIITSIIIIIIIKMLLINTLSFSVTNNADFVNFNGAPFIYIQDTKSFYASAGVNASARNLFNYTATVSRMF